VAFAILRGRRHERRAGDLDLLVKRQRRSRVIETGGQRKIFSYCIVFKCTLQKSWLPLDLYFYFIARIHEVWKKAPEIRGGTGYNVPFNQILNSRAFFWLMVIFFEVGW